MKCPKCAFTYKELVVIKETFRIYHGNNEGVREVYSSIFDKTKMMQKQLKEAK